MSDDQPDTGDASTEGQRARQFDDLPPDEEHDVPGEGPEERTFDEEPDDD